MLSEREIGKRVFATARKAIDAEIERLRNLEGKPIKLEPSRIIVSPAMYAALNSEAPHAE
jgi:hypothetical protein